MTPRKIMQGHLNIVSHYTGLSTHACMQAHRLSPSHIVSKLATAPLIITLFSIPTSCTPRQHLAHVLRPRPCHPGPLTLTPTS